MGKSGPILITVKHVCGGETPILWVSLDATALQGINKPGVEFLDSGQALRYGQQFVVGFRLLGDSIPSAESR